MVVLYTSVVAFEDRDVCGHDAKFVNTSVVATADWDVCHHDTQFLYMYIVAFADWDGFGYDAKFQYMFVVCEVLVLVQMSGSNLQFFTVMRLVRLARIARVIRVSRFKVFKELLLVIRGIIAGLRTLFWAIVFSLFVIFVLGIFMRQTTKVFRAHQQRHSSRRSG